MTTLLYDIARCPGVPNLPDEPPGWREGCETCLRRTAPGSPQGQAWIEPETPVQHLSQATIDFLKETLEDCDDSARDAFIGHDIEKMLRASTQHSRIEELKAQLSATHPTQQGLEQFIEQAGDVHFQKCRVGSKEGAIRWDIEFGHYGDEVRGKTLREAITKAIAAQAKQGGQ